MSLTESTMLELGTTAPDFALTDVVSGETVRRDDFRGSQALLVLFICAHCPYVKHIEKGLAALGRDYAGKPLGLVAISSNDAVTHPADNPAGLKQQAETFGFNFPYLYDETQAVANSTPAAPATEFPSPAKTCAPPSIWCSPTSRSQRSSAPPSAATSNGRHKEPPN